MSGFDNDTVYANNADFSRAGAGGGSATNGLQLNGQLWIGSTTLNPGGTHVTVGTLKSAAGTLSIINGPGTINLEVAGGTTTVQTLTGDSGGPLSPTAGNINTLGSGSITISGSGSTLTTQLTGLTNHALLVGAGTTTITKVGPTATAGQILQSAGSSADPVFSTATYPATATSAGTILRADGTNWVATTATYPATTTISQLLYSSANNVVGGLSTANNGLLVTSATGVPSILAGPGTSGNILQSNAAAAPSFSNATYPVSTTINQVLYSSSNNVVAGITAANNGTLISGTTGIPSWLANGTTGQILTATTGSPPSWASPATSGTVTSVSVVSANGFAGTVATATTTPAITLTTTVTGVLSGNGTAISGSTVTQHGVLVGGASNAVGSTAVGSTGQVLQANSSADPTYSTATYPSVATTTGTILRADGTNWVKTTATYPNTAGTSGNVLTSDGTNWVSQAASGSGGGKVTAQAFTATGAFTYTPTANMVTCIIEILGAGGASGGIAAPANTAAAGGGGAGSYLRFYATSAQIGASASGSIGTGGTVGTAGNNPGNAGGDTTFTIGGGTAWTAKGGSGGTGSANQAGNYTTAGGASNANTTGTNATLMANIQGQPGDSAWGSSGSAIGIGGEGGNPPFFGSGGHGAKGTTTGVSAGNVGKGKGAGGGGAAGFNSASTSAGSAGTDGFCLVTEFLSG